MLLAMLPAGAYAAPSFTIYRAPTPTYTTIDMVSVSGDGRYIVGELGSNTTLRATRWTVGSSETVDIGLIPGYPYSTSTDLSQDGSAAAANGRAGGTYQPRPFLWNEAGSKSPVPLPPGATFAYATDISNDGTTIAGWTNLNNLSRLWRWTAATGTVLDGMPGGYMDTQFAHLMSGNARYTVMGSRRFDSQTQTALDIGRLIGADNTPSSAPSILDISNDGKAVVGEIREFYVGAGMYSGRIAFRWTEAGGIEPLATPTGAHNYYARHISGDGTVVLGSEDGAPFIWTEQAGIKPLADLLAENGLSDHGLSFIAFSSVNDDGSVITGRGYLPSGELIGWVLTLPVPEPTVLGMLLAASVTLNRRR
jgi:uncharacterized membrane protein